MPKVILGRERRLADKVLRLLPKQKDVCKVLGRSQPDVSYRMRKVYPEMLVECFKLLDMAGYEVREKE